MIDSHCHLADAAFAADAAEVVDRARAAGLSHALCILAADSPDEIERATALADLWPALRFATGVHPHQAGAFGDAAADVANTVRSAVAAVPGVRGLGEIGLDYHYDFAAKPAQHQVFRAQIQLSRELDLPVIIHTREAEDDTLAILRDEGQGHVRGVLHCFTGTPRLAEEGLALGLHISFAGIVTFPKAGNLRDIAAMVPADRILCETDCPYLAPVPYRGKRNEPAWVVRVAEELARARDVPVEDLQRQMDANFATLFRP